MIDRSELKTILASALFKGISAELQVQEVEGTLELFVGAEGSGRQGYRLIIERLPDDHGPHGRPFRPCCVCSEPVRNGGHHHGYHARATYPPDCVHGNPSRVAHETP